MEVVSTMGTGSLGREIDLEPLVAGLENSTFPAVDVNFTSNGMVTIRFEENGPAYTLYRTGSFQIRGASSKQRLEESVNRLKAALSDIGLESPSFEFDHVTSVFMEDFENEVNLEALTIHLGLENTEYEPEQFPGLVYRPPEHPVTLLVFASGKIIVGGTTVEEEAQSAIEVLRRNITAIGNQ